jgi:branched-chain amino acid transport system ATP-binding protein
MSVSPAVLEVSGLAAGYGDTLVVRGVDLAVSQGTTAVVIGPNGHGKTTMLRAICGLIRPAAGEVRFLGERVDGRSAESLATMGLVHVMQGDGLFADMSVEENLLMGAFPGSSWKRRREALARVYDRFPIVRARRHNRARTLSGGERRLVALGRGLMREARLLLIDEPSLGLAPVMIETVYEAVRDLRASSSTSILLVEENFSHIRGVADVVHVVEMGSIVRSGSLAELERDRVVMESYLGTV